MPNTPVTIQNDPIYSLPYLYINRMNISVASTTVIAIAPGQCRDGQNQIDMPIGQPGLEGITNPGGFYPNSINYGPVTGLFPAPKNWGYSAFPNYYPEMPIFINTATVGANGLDAGTLAASSLYCIYIIGDSRNIKPVAGIMSLYSNAFPLLPLGYDSYRLLGFVQTDGSTHLVAADVLNTSSSKAFYLQPAIAVLSGGNATTFTAIDFTTNVPADVFTTVMLTTTFIPAAAGDFFQFRPTSSSATSGLITVVGRQAGIAQTDLVNAMVGISTTAQIDYKVSSSSDSLSVSLNGYITTLA